MESENQDNESGDDHTDCNGNLLVKNSKFMAWSKYFGQKMNRSDVWRRAWGILASTEEINKGQNKPNEVIKK